jgi:wobble nucleotide-excising tRNase
MPLDKIIDVQKVGRFEKLHVPTGIRFSKLTLVFGENGWGKSTIADILRSVSTREPKILTGRETLASAGTQKVLLLVDGNQAEFNGEAWQGPCPKVAVYDQIFVNQNIFSGDSVSHDHLKRQYGLVVGETGVSLMRDIVRIDEEVGEVSTTIRRYEHTIQGVIATLGANSLSVDQFISLEQLDNGDQAIAEMEAAVRRLEQIDQIGRAPLPDQLPEPSSTESLRFLLASSVDGVATDAHRILRAHIERYHAAEGRGNSAMAHEVWLEAGLSYVPDDPCPFCGQELQDRLLVDAYRDFFSNAYKELAARVQRSRATIERHVSGEYADTIRRAMTGIATIESNWRALADVEEPGITMPDEALALLIDAATGVDALLELKQRDLVSALPEQDIAGALTQWEEAVSVIKEINQQIRAYREGLIAIRDAQDAADLPAQKTALSILRARTRRYEPDMVVNNEELQNAQLRKAALAIDKTAKRGELTVHTTAVTQGLGATINAYLDRLGAGFRIDYQPPNYRGKEPAASYNLLINDVPVQPRTAQDDIGTPCFKNTLSAGDKSVLSLAIFLATLKSRDDLNEVIVVLDDPFTSMDDFRRSFTVNEINKLTTHVSQIFVLSHEKGFLRSIWDTVDRDLVTSLSIQTGAPGLASIAHFDLEAATRPRHLTERMEVEEFCQQSIGSPPHIRRLLRNVLEVFYRQADPELFLPDDLLGSIIAKIEAAPPAYRYKAALDYLTEVNRYTRAFHHAPVVGAAVEDTNVEELRTYCSRVLGLTRGSA